jgi:hypothetical protein
MKTEQRTIYVARDGREFMSEAQCRAHERKTCGDALIGLTAAQVEAARTREDAELADAIEAFGYELRRARQASGQLKRRRTPGEAKSTSPVTQAATHDEPRIDAETGEFMTEDLP